jgi:hypothetical protein
LAEAGLASGAGAARGGPNGFEGAASGLAPGAAARSMYRRKTLRTRSEWRAGMVCCSIARSAPLAASRRRSERGWAGAAVESEEGGPSHRAMVLRASPSALASTFSDSKGEEGEGLV